MSHININTLREQRADLVTEAKAVLASITDQTPEGEVAEVEARFDAMIAEADKLAARIDREQRLLDAEAALEARVEQRAERAKVSKGEAANAIDIEARAFNRYLRHGMTGLNDEERSIMAGRLSEVRAQGTSTDSAGGYTVAPAFANQILSALKAYGGMRSVATVISTDTGADLTFVTEDHTLQKGRIISENTQVPEQDVSFGTASLKSHIYTSDAVRCSLALLQDSAFDLEGFIAGKLAERLGRIQNEHFTTGTGSSQPRGIVTAVSAGVTGASATAVTLDELMDLQHSIDPAYRPRAGWMFNDSTLKVLRKLKDGDGRPLWQPSLVAGEPDLFLGARYTINQDMPSLAASQKAILFGDMSKYHIRDVKGVTIMRLAERWADFLQIGFLGYLRTDGNLLDVGGAVKAFQTAAA